MADLSSLLPYAATDRQLEVLQTVIECGSNQKAAKKLGLGRRTVDVAVSRVKAHAARQGWSPDHDMTRTVPQGFAVKGVSTYYDEEGKVRGQWVKSHQADQQESLINCLENLEYKPAPIIAKPKGHFQKNLISLYTLTDFHLAMYAWAQECGDDWDTEIASRVLIYAIQDMIAKAPNAHTAILNLQGDFLHWDGLDAITPTSHHVLEADTRFERMIELALDLTMHAIELLLRKHQQVRVVICEGNHDLAGSAWLRKAMKKLFVRNKRVEIDDTAFPYYAYLHGETMLAFHHGHKKKNKDLPALFASEPRYREMWGRANYCYIHTGHYHHAEQDMAEGGGAIVERHPTLAARDSYAARGGFISRRGARVITYHTTDGEVERATVLPRSS